MSKDSVIIKIGEDEYHTSVHVGISVLTEYQKKLEAEATLKQYKKVIERTSGREKEKCDVPF